MEWNIDKSRQICPQICEQICVRIANGEWKSNDKLPSVRDISVMAGVNPNTVQRSFEQLESQNVVYSVRGSGWYVSEDETTAKNTLKKIIEDKTASYFEEMKLLGLDIRNVKEYVKEWKE